MLPERGAALENDIEPEGPAERPPPPIPPRCACATAGTASRTAATNPASIPGLMASPCSTPIRRAQARFGC